MVCFSQYRGIDSKLKNGKLFKCIEIVRAHRLYNLVADRKHSKTANLSQCRDRELWKCRGSELVGVKIWKALFHLRNFKMYYN